MSSEYVWNEPMPSRASHPIPKSAHGHFVIQMVIHDSDEDPGQISKCGSMGEYHTRMIALAEPDTVDVIEQVGPLHWQDKKNETRAHFLDHLVIKDGGKRVGLTDKPAALVTENFQAEIAQVREDGRQKKFFNELYLVTEFARDPITLFNAELIRGCRDEEGDVDAIALTVVADVTSKATLDELIRQINRGPRGFRALVRLIGSGHLVLWKHEKISRDSVVVRGVATHD
jgi:hypothetical protein